MATRKRPGQAAVLYRAWGERTTNAEPVHADERPKTRADCETGPRPCPWAGCQYHLAIDISAGGGIKVNHPTKEPHQLEETCALDVADRGYSTLQEVGELMNLSRERLRQIETRALRKLRAYGRTLIEPDDWETGGKR